MGTIIPTNELVQSTDAMLWAEQFVLICQENGIDPVLGDDPEGFMVGWFANAIEVGRDAGRARVEELEAENERLSDLAREVIRQNAKNGADGWGDYEPTVNYLARLAGEALRPAAESSAPDNEGDE